MSNKNKSSGPSGPSDAPKSPGGRSETPAVSVKPASGTDRPIRRTFPGPRGASAPLRVAVERSAHGELIGHAKSSLECEVCGVLVGHICEDDEGIFVHVEAVIRGAAATQASTHVTFTQATWNGIHETLERDYPKLKMVGWYHTHPGFGVEFSDMDLFIQRNFFSGPTQIALVTDPLNGAVAIVANFPGGIEYLPRFWVDGREQSCQEPARGTGARAAADATGGAMSPAAQGGSSLAQIEARLNQVIQVLDDTRASYHRFLMFVGMVFCLGVIAVVGYTIYNQFGGRFEPPRANQMVPVPVQVGDKVVMLGVGILEWQVPPEVNAAFVQVELLKREAAVRAEKAAREAAEKAAATNRTNAPPSK